MIDKEREIYFVGNVKIHIDAVRGLGHFVEIEAIDEEGSIGRAELFDYPQCTLWTSSSDLIGGAVTYKTTSATSMESLLKAGPGTPVYARCVR